MEVTREDFDRFVRHGQELVPGFKVYDGKTDSYLMNLIDGIIFPFNKNFLRRYITTVGKKVYFPDGLIDRAPKAALEIAGHELVHAYDVKRLTGILFGFVYLFPLSLVLPALIALGIFISWAAFIPFAAMALHAGAVAVSYKLRRYTGFPLLAISVVAAIVGTAILSGWGALWILGVCIFLAPLPAPGRTWAELRGYGMSVFLEIKLYGQARIKPKIKQFTGPAYYFMWPFKKRILKSLNRYKDKALNGTLRGTVFDHVDLFIETLDSEQVKSN